MECDGSVRDNAMTEAEKIAANLSSDEREWLTEWDGPCGAAWNTIGVGMAKRRLTISYKDWNLSPLGLAVRAHLERQNAPVPERE